MPARLLGGALANWLVGMAAFLAVMGRTIIGKYISVLFLVSVFVALPFWYLDGRRPPAPSTTAAASTSPTTPPSTN